VGFRPGPMDSLQVSVLLFFRLDLMASPVSAHVVAADVTYDRSQLCKRDASGCMLMCGACYFSLTQHLAKDVQG